MPFKTPEFWYRPEKSEKPIIETLLTPVSYIYNIGHYINTSLQKTKSINIPVICIGNITAGGGGKTPTIIALHKLLVKQKIFESPCFLSRGYGGSESQTRRIEAHEGANIVGDEPLLLSSHSNTIISKNRYEGSYLAHDLGYDCVLMDDGFQNQTLHKDTSLIVIDGNNGFGNKKTIPAGPLREKIPNALKRTSAVILIGEDKTNVSSIIPNHIPIFSASVQASNLTQIDQTQRYIAFAGLAHPKKFLNTLNDHNMNIVEFHEFADHHPYSEKDLQSLLSKAEREYSRLITTEKDYQRIPSDLKNMIDVLSIEVVFEDEKVVTEFLVERLKENK